MRKLASILFRLLLAVLIVFWTALAALAGSFVWRYVYQLDIPDARRVAALSSAKPVCFPESGRTFVALVSIPPLVRDAILAAEEPDFFRRAPVPAHLIQGAASRGSATMSQRVASCLLSSSSLCCKESLDRHIATLILMFRIEQTLSRKTIFELYVNQLYFGRGAWSLGAAAAVCFDKPLSELTIAEAAYLAGLVKAPNNYNRNNERGLERRNFVIDRMLGAGSINAEQAAAAKQKPLRFRENPAPI